VNFSLPKRESPSFFFPFLSPAGDLRKIGPFFPFRAPFPPPADVKVDIFLLRKLATHPFPLQISLESGAKSLNRLLSSRGEAFSLFLRRKDSSPIPPLWEENVLGLLPNLTAGTKVVSSFFEEGDNCRPFAFGG